jgi:hypothetical protein
MDSTPQSESKHIVLKPQQFLSAYMDGSSNSKLSSLKDKDITYFSASAQNGRNKVKV